MTGQKQEAPLEYYRAKYAVLDPEQASRRAGLPFDPELSRFTVEALGQVLYAYWPDFNIVPEYLDICPKILYNFEMQLLTMQFLLTGVSAPLGGRFMAYRELPWGEVYDANFQKRCVERFAYAFGNDTEKFEKAAERLGGTKQALGDASYDLQFFGGVICRMILWKPDDEFPPSAQILFSDNTQLSFNAEALAGLGDVVIGALKEASKQR